MIQESQGKIPERKAEHLGTSDRGVILLRRIWRRAMENIAKGRDPKGVFRRERGMLEVDTFHGHIKASELVISSKKTSLPLWMVEGLSGYSSGNLVFN